MSRKKFLHYTIYITVTLIFMFGIFARLDFYSFGRALQGDECALGWNLINVAHLGDFFKPLTENQAAPPLFIMLSALFMKIIPDVELALRFLPFAASIAAIGVFYLLARKVMDSNIAIYTAMAVFCFNINFINYAQWFKPYSTDVLVFLCILLSYFYVDFKKLSIRNAILTGLGYGLCIWFSFPSVIAIASVMLLLLIKNLSKDGIIKLISISLPILISGILLIINQMPAYNNEYLHNFWSNGFVARNFSNLFIVMFSDFIFDIFSEYYHGFSIITVIILITAGIITAMAGFKKDKNLILLIPFLTAILFSYCHIYPLERRIALYLAPVVILFAVKFIDMINFKISNNAAKNAVTTALALLLAIPAINQTLDWNKFGKYYETEDAYSILLAAQKKMTDKDVLYVPFDESINFRFYNQIMEKKEGHVIFPNVFFETADTANEYYYYNVNLDRMTEVLDELPKGKTYYYFFCTFYNHKAEALYKLTEWGKTKNNYKLIYEDSHHNGLIRFSL